MKVTIKPKANPVAPNRLHEHREEYLSRAVDRLSRWFKKRMNREIPPVRVSCGWPYGSSGRSTKKLGQCWDRRASKDGVAQIFISPMLDETEQVIGVLAHELVHATVGVDDGHGGEFKAVARGIDLIGKLTECYPGTDLTLYIREQITAILGTYPHAALKLDDEHREEATGEKKEGTRMVKCWCPVSGYTCRTTKKWLEQFGPPISPKTRKPMQTDYIPSEPEAEEKKAKDGGAE